MMASGGDEASIAILISGDGTNLQAIIDAVADNRITGTIALVASDNPDAYGLERARLANIPTATLTARDHPDRDDYDRVLAELIADSNPDLVVLAGFMRILGSDFVDRFAGRILNIHPALLPHHKGLHTHRRVLEAGDSEHGASVHFVTAELDGGPVVIQATVTVFPDDDEATLAARVLVQEHDIYPCAIRLFVDGRLTMTNGIAQLDGRILDQPLLRGELQKMTGKS